MTDTTTRERVAGAIDSALRNNAVVGLSFRALESATDAALAAMQPPTETRWVPDVDATVNAHHAAMVEANLRGVTHQESVTEGYRAQFFAMLRDFADGVSRETVEVAAQRIGIPPTTDEARSFLRALADQEEGK